MSNTSETTQLLSCDEMLSLGMNVSDFLEALEDDLGPEAVWKLTEAFGGRALCIPKRETMHRTTAAEKLGTEITAWLLDRLGPGATQIPLGPCARKAKNIAAFRAAFLAGKPRPQIAEEMNCHMRTVERMAARLRNAGFI